MANKTENATLGYHDKLPIDALRFILVNAIEQATKQKMQLKSQGKKTVYLITHDVDSRKGLDHALAVKKIEEKYDVASTWFVPSNHYPLDSNVLSALGNHGEIGSHDTEHDGKLASMHGTSLTKRLQESKTALEKLSGCKVNGFRAPLLQHTFPMLEGLKEAAFLYDSSAPTFEPNHPRTMGPHGVGTVYPLKVGGILEIPLTIIQDHQLLYTLGLKSAQVIDFWRETAVFVRALGGLCVALCHPEYDLLTNDLSLYENFLNDLSSDKTLTVCLPSELVRAKRSEA
jgi:hypothetical protein